MLKWTDVEKKSFYEIKLVVYRDTLFSYPYFTRQFNIIMDARDFQLGELIGQEVIPIVFYRLKLM